LVFGRASPRLSKRDLYSRPLSSFPVDEPFFKAIPQDPLFSSFA
jgi:hypothetical protein